MNPGHNTNNRRLEVLPSLLGRNLTTLFTTERLLLVAAIFISIFAALALVQLEGMFQMALIMIFPAIVIAFLILKNPYAGVFLFFLYDFLRPYDFIPGLAPLRLTLLIEVLTLVSWGIMYITYRQPIRWDRFSWIYLCFLGFMGLSGMLAANTFYSSKAFQIIATYFVVFVIAVNTVDTPKRLGKIVWLLLFTHGYFATKGIINYVLGINQIAWQRTVGLVGSSFIGDENDFAMAINVMIPMAYMMIQHVKSTPKRAILVGLMILFIVSVVCSFSRGGLVGLMAATGFCVWFSRKRVVGFAVAIVAGILLVVLAPSEYKTEIQTITDTRESTAAARLRYWRAGFDMFIDNPVFGVGPDNGALLMPKYIKGVAADKIGTAWGRAFHGTMPQVMAELGLPGTILYLTMLFTVLAFLNRIRKRRSGDERQVVLSSWATAMIGSIFAYMVTATFLSTAYYPQLWTLYTLSAVVFWLQFRYDNQAEEITDGTGASSVIESPNSRNTIN